MTQKRTWLKKTAYMARNFKRKRDSTDTKCPMRKKLEDTTDHVLEYEKANTFTLSEENNKGEHEEITEVYRKKEKEERKCSNSSPGLEQDN